MASSKVSILVRRAFRFSVSSPPPPPPLRHRLSYSSLASRPSSHFYWSTEISETRGRPHSLLSFRFMASNGKAKPKPRVNADENLGRVLASEIDCAQQDGFVDQSVDLPDGFPFEIIDNPGDQGITLKREFAGEKIQVNVFMDLDEMGDGKDDDEDDDEDDNSSPVKMSLIAMVDKGHGLILEFCCDLTSNKLHIESMLLKEADNPDDENAYQGPEFSDLDMRLQDAFCRYLEVRGIKASLFDFLHDYMMAKDEREYLTWLKNMKSFIEK